MRRRCQPNSVSGVTSHPARLGRGSAAAIAPSKLRSASVNSSRSTCRRSTPSWWRNTMISRSFERPDRTVSRASDATNRYKIRYTTTQHRPTSRQVNDHGRVSGTHRAPRDVAGEPHDAGRFGQGPVGQLLGNGDSHAPQRGSPGTHNPRLPTRPAVALTGYCARLGAPRDPRPSYPDRVGRRVGSRTETALRIPSDLVFVVMV